MKTWFVTGASRGLGLEIARAALASGDQVVATARTASRIQDALGQSDRLLALDLDVTRASAIDAGVATAISHFGRIDILVNNAGYGQLGWFENISDQQILDQFDVNVFGVMRVTRAALPHMRAQHSGQIFIISSMAGQIGTAGASIYCSSKHALEGWVEGLAQEVEPFGISVTSVEPGYFRTDFLDPSSIVGSALDIADYAQVTAEFTSGIEATNHQQSGDPAKLGTLMVKLAAMPKPPLRIPVGSDASAIMAQKGASLVAVAAELKELSISTDRDDAG